MILLSKMEYVKRTTKLAVCLWGSVVVCPPWTLRWNRE